MKQPMSSIRPKLMRSLSWIVCIALLVSTMIFVTLADDSIVETVENVEYTNEVNPADLIVNERGWIISFDCRRINIIADNESEVIVNGESVAEKGSYVYSSDGTEFGNVWELGTSGRKQYVLNDGEYTVVGNGIIRIEYMDAGYYEKIVEYSSETKAMQVNIGNFSTQKVECSMADRSSEVEIEMLPSRTFSSEELDALNVDAEGLIAVSNKAARYVLRDGNFTVLLDEELANHLLASWITKVFALGRVHNLNRDFDFESVKIISLCIPAASRDLMQANIKLSTNITGLYSYSSKYVEFLIRGESWAGVDTPGDLKISLSEFAPDQKTACIAVEIQGEDVAWNSPDYPILLRFQIEDSIDRGHGVVVRQEADGSEHIIPRSLLIYGTDFAEDLGDIPSEVKASVSTLGTYGVRYVSIPEFLDTNGRWMAKPVGFMSARGILKGVGDNRFEPDTMLTNAHFVTMLMRTLDIDNQQNAAKQFEDYEMIPSWAQEYAELAFDLGIIRDDSKGHFNPYDPISREDVFVMVYNALEYIHVFTERMPDPYTSFDDWDEVSEYAKPAVENLAGLGLITGYNNRLFPKDTLTRAEAAQIIYNIIIWECSTTHILI